MELTSLINSLNVIKVIGELQRADVSGISYNSRKIRKNFIFTAIKGYKTDGHIFINDAIKNGALAIILEDNSSIPDEIFIHNKIAKILVKDSRRALAEISTAFYKYPSADLSLTGITGTNGKTTTAYILKSIFEHGGARTGMLGTISNYIGDLEIRSDLTTPESNELNEMLMKMKDSGCSQAVMEVSSHSLVLNRVYNLRFKNAVFTNFSSDHLDFHKTVENYFNAKKILFDGLSENAFCIYNLDDINGRKIVDDSKAKCYSYGKDDNADFNIGNIKYNLNGTSFNIKYDGNSYPVSSSLIGEFNAYNICAAFAVSVLSGFQPELVTDGIKSAKQVPGRFEVIGSGLKKVIVDYSHTADSLNKVLEAIRLIKNNEQPIYTVFGCGGDRDKTKRPEMGRIASELSDFVIISSDNPRSEDPLKIIDQIESGIKKKNYSVIESREEAIKSAILNSEKNAVILIAGKGHENYQEVKNEKYHFSDKEIVEKYLLV